jgi:hypothetical protein
MEKITISRPPKSIVRADRDLLTPNNISSLAEHYGEYYEIINDLGFYISHKIQNQDANLFNEYVITIKDFCDFTGRKNSNIGKKVKDKDGNILVANSIKDAEGNNYELNTVIEHALLKMTQPVLLKSFSKYRDSVNMKFQNFNFIDGFEVVIPNKKTKQRYYKLSLNKMFFGALLKSFINLNVNNFSKIKGKKLYPLYMFLSELKTTAELQQINNSDDVVSSPYFELLKKVCDIDSEKASYVKQKIEQKIKNISKLTELKFKHTWTTTSSMRFPYQLHIFWENDVIPKAQLDILYKKYSESYYNFILNESFDRYNSNNENTLRFAAWFNLEETKKTKVKAFVTSYNFINNKNVTEASEVIYNRFGVLDMYISELRTFHKESLKAEESKFKIWFEYILKEKSETKNYKTIRTKAFRDSIKEKLGYPINNKTIYNTLLKAEKMITLKK